MEGYEQKQIRRASQFLERLGLSYNSVTPATQKYILDMAPTNNFGSDNPAMVAMNKQFEKTVSDEMVPMSGGRITFPAEYFGAPDSGAYQSVQPDATVASTVPVDGCTARFGEASTFAGGASQQGGYLNAKDLALMKASYQKKYLRQLRMPNASKEALLRRLNNKLDVAVMNAVKKNKGRLTKTALVAELK
jgi:hypothetical protein